MRAIEKKAGLILGGILLFSLVLVGVVMVQAVDEANTDATVTVNEFLDITLSGAIPIAFSSTDPGTSDNPANV
ncbi:MAG: hypothetical protein IIC67_12065, partial [Thaumarchaeota archaeon]|nr:hypothetical protein [Nitrososphaerota archaeon]